MRFLRWNHPNSNRIWIRTQNSVPINCHNLPQAFWPRNLPWLLSESSSEPGLWIHTMSQDIKRNSKEIQKILPKRMSNEFNVNSNDVKSKSCEDQPAEDVVLLQMFARFCSWSIAYCTFSVRMDLEQKVPFWSILCRMLSFKKRAISCWHPWSIMLTSSNFKLPESNRMNK